jgi:N-acetylglucosamine-6-sulfatase
MIKRSSFTRRQFLKTSAVSLTLARPSVIAANDTIRMALKKVFLLALLFCLAPGAAMYAQTSRKPNIVLILVDDLRWDALGATGHPYVKTPNIDRIAKEGMIFRNAFVTTPLCSPSRSSFLTGQYVHKTGVTGNGPNLERAMQLQTFPRLLQQAGYTTGYFGKWHMGNHDQPKPGFDRWVSFRGQGRYIDVPLNVDGQAVDNKGYTTDVLSDYAVEFIRRKHDKPFLTYLAHKAVHGPFDDPPGRETLYADQAVKRSPNAQDSLEGKSVLQRTIDNQPAVRPGGGSGDKLIRTQLRMLTVIDEGVGRILKALEETGQLDNTIIIFTSDNGYFWGEHGLGDKRFAYEESIRIPLLARYPKLIKAGSERKQMALNIDIAPTLLELGGAKIPVDAHGRSLAPLFKADSQKWRSSFLAEYFAEPQFPRCPTWQAVRTEQWKYIHYTELDGMDELYDLKNDPYELKNRINERRAQSTLEQMKKMLGDELHKTR